uniref:Tetratricopeptide TPR_2 n=2 Tax=Phyllobacteriaceae TaxID=69277 RepID=Q11JY1_CHESB
MLFAGSDGSGKCRIGRQLAPRGKTDIELNMFFWVLAALLTLAAALAVMRPFLRGLTTDVAGREHDLSVYRDQLAELDQEVRRGLVAETEAAEARAEIGRRILRLSQSVDESAEGSVKPGTRLARAVAIAAVLAVPAISWGIYSLIGSPGLPAMPLQARLNEDPAQAPVEDLVARAEAYLADHPEDVRGWQTLAPVYMRLGRYSDAVAAYQRAIDLAGANPEYEAGLGEAMVARSGGIVTAGAEAAFNRALALDEKNARARFFIALARAQEGNGGAARAIWEEMASGLPEQSPWKAAAARAIAGLAQDSAQASASESAPSQDQLAAAQEMTPEARQEMIEGMVASLDAKLRESPADPEGWGRLLRSYVVLGRRDDALGALDRGLSALGPDSPDGKALSELAGTLGLTDTQVNK